MRLLRNHPGWANLTRKGVAGITITFDNVVFYIFRDDASHYLRAIPQSAAQLAAVRYFNALMRSCRRELSNELDLWNMARLNRDDNEGD